MTVLCDFNVGVFAAIAGWLMGWGSGSRSSFVTSGKDSASPFWGGLMVGGLVAYVLLDGIVPAFIRGWFATIPLLIFAVSLPMKGRTAQMVSTLGTTSMGVYLVHPLITRALSVVWVRVFPAPFGVLPVLSEWLLAWSIAFAAAFVLLRLPGVNRLVR